MIKTAKAPESAHPETNGADPRNADPAPKVAKRTKAARSPKAKGTKKKRKPASTDRGSQSGKGTTFTRRPFPQNSLEDALTIPQAIKDKNNGNPLNTDLVAKAVNLSRQGGKFYYLCASARDYGLTIGSRDTDEIALDEIGRAVVFADTPQFRRQKQIDAFLKIEPFKKVFDYYGGTASLPEGEFVSNVLQNRVGLAKEEHESFLDLFKRNCKFLEVENGLGDVPQPRSTTGRPGEVDIAIVGQPRGKFDRTAFVIMPFSEKGQIERPKGFFDEVLKSLITPAGNSAKFAVETARREGSDVIHHTIINQLIEADLVVADLTDHNPSVLFELGIRIAMNKPVCLIKAEGTGAIFDVDNMMRVLSYSPNLWVSTLKTDVLKLTDHINGAWDTRETGHSYMTILTAPHQAGRAAVVSA
jgi:hypothetical protein